MDDRNTKTIKRTNLARKSVRDTGEIGGAGKSGKKKEPPLQGAALDKWRRDHLFPNRESNGIFYNVGARNPYALAERIHFLTHKRGKHPIEWLDNQENPLAWKTNRKKLMDIFNSIPKFENITYEQLFDPSHIKISPPLFSSRFYIPKSKLSANKAPREISRPEVKRAGIVKKPGKSVLLSATPTPTLTVQPETLQGNAMTVNAPVVVKNTAAVLPGIAPCSERGTHWDYYKIPGTANRAYYYKVKTNAPSDIIDDVVQGCTRNCYFLAALASNVWTKYGRFPPDRSAALKDTYTITFHYSDGTTRDIQIESSLILDAANAPVMSQPSILNEVWHAIYEKAYGIFLLLPQSTLPYFGPFPNLPRPNIPDYPTGEPLESLRHLTGSSWENSFYDTAINKNNCFNLMQPALRYNATYYGTTIYPMVAYSYPDENAAYDANNPVRITYDNEIIVANHCYSILGTVNLDANNRYIVLRNPYGRMWGADPDNHAFGQYLYKDIWTPTPDFSRPMLTVDGIFALKDYQFELYFKRFGWVQ